MSSSVGRFVMRSDFGLFGMAEILCPSQQAFARKPASRKHEVSQATKLGLPSPQARAGDVFPCSREYIRLGFAIFRPIRAGIFV
jgi:hypothetical protein